LKKGAITLGKTALKTGANIAKDGLSGRSLKSSLKQNLKSAGSDLLNKSIQSVMRKSPVKPIKRKRKREMVSMQTEVKAKRKKKSKDIFS
jgi:hypothetical protein